jgi:hypothetical protein
MTHFDFTFLGCNFFDFCRYVLRQFGVSVP